MQNKLINIKYICILLLILIPNILSASPILSITDKQASYTDFQLEYYTEEPGRFTEIEEIKKVNFTKETSNTFNFGYQNDEFWFHLKVKNNMSTDQNIVLSLTETYYENVDLYTVSDGLTLQYKNGLEVPVKIRNIQESNPSFSIPLKAGTSKDLYLKVATTKGLMGAIELKKEETFFNDLQIKKYLYLSYFVAIFTIILYNLIFFLYFKDTAYLNYIIYTLLFILWVAAIKGPLLSFIPLSLYSIFQDIIPLYFIFFILFSREILETKKYYPRLDKIYTNYIYLAMAATTILFVFPKNGFYFMNLISIPLLVFLLVSTLWLLQKRVTLLIKMYIAAFFINILVFIEFNALFLGYLPYNETLSNLIVYISIIEIILFSLLLAYRINIIRNESLESREALIEQQKTESTRLFHTVAEKTKALNLAKKEIEEELRKKIELEKHLQHLASTDPMTELYNRRAFFEIAELEVSSAKSKQEKFTCLIIDIDHFKRINDTYGHGVGDTVITAVSKLMVLNTRTKDHIGRIGGEEFAILMPKTSTEAAYQIADRLRENISKHSIAIDGSESVKITISIGLSTLTTDEDETIHTLLKRADTALYKAKDNGRNQVRCLPEKDAEES